MNWEHNLSLETLGHLWKCTCHQILGSSFEGGRTHEVQNASILCWSNNIHIISATDVCSVRVLDDFFNVIKCYTKCQTIARQLLQQWDTLISSHYSSENFKLYSVLFHHCKLYTYCIYLLLYLSVYNRNIVHCTLTLKQKVQELSSYSSSPSTSRLTNRFPLHDRVRCMNYFIVLLKCCHLLLGNLTIGVAGGVCWSARSGPLQPLPGGGRSPPEDRQPPRTAGWEL